MKSRNGFVSNSSTSSFICDICGEKYTGMDASPHDPDWECCVCPHEHIMCNEHMKNIEIKVAQTEGCEHDYDRTKSKFCNQCGADAWVDEEEGYISSECCPICQFKFYSESEMAKYLEKTRGTSRDEVFTKIKAINKRRKKLYEAEFITHVCESFDLNDDILLAEIKDKFGTFEKYKEFLVK